MIFLFIYVKGSKATLRSCCTFVALKLVPQLLVNARFVRLIKNLTEPGLFAMLFLPINAMLRRMMLVLSRVPAGWIVGLRSWHCTDSRCGPFNQLVEFTPIKPNASALRAVINFNALALGHQET
jgi:hypothetical protein